MKVLGVSMLSIMETDEFDQDDEHVDSFPSNGGTGRGGGGGGKRSSGFGRKISSMSLLSARERKLSRSDGALNIRLMMLNEENEAEEGFQRSKDESFTKVKGKRKDGITKVPEIMSKFLKTNAQRTKRRKESFISRIMSNEKDDVTDDVSNSCLLRYAVRKFDTGRVIDLVSNPDLNIDGASEKGITALHEASIDGNITCMKILVNHGADINKCDSEGFTPLDYAVFGGNFECASYLIEKGAKDDRIRDGQIVYKEEIHTDSKINRRSTFS